MFKTLFLKIEETSVFGEALAAQHNALTLRSIGPIVSEIWQKCLKPYFFKLKKRQCIQRSASCWAQRVDTQVDWPNSFWDMTKMFKTLFLQIEETTVYSAQR